MLWLTLGALGAVAHRALTLVPSSHDFGKAAVQGEVYREFRISGVTATTAPTLRATLTGRDPDDWYLQNDGMACWWDGRSDSLHRVRAPSAFSGTCDPFAVTFKPRTEGRKTAMLVVTDQLGNRVAAQLTGEAVAALCTNRLVFCNYAHHYSGTISLTSVDTVLTEDHQARSEVAIEIAVTLGQVQCTGYRREFERSGYKGEMDTEIKGEGSISGPGLLAIEFDYRGRQPVYLLTFACPAPAMRRTNIALKAGTATEQRFPAEPADWGGSEMVADPQPSREPMMSPLQGSFRHDRLDPENSTGGYTRTSWNLRRP